MGTKCKKTIQGVGIALMLAVNTTAWCASPINLDDLFADFDDDSWLQAASFTGRVEFAGYKLGEPYHSLTNGAKVVCDDVVKCYTPTVSLDPPHHGIKSLNLCLSPQNHILVSMSSSKVDFKDRQELMNDGCAILNDLLKDSANARLRSKIKYTAPHWQYWPSRKRGYLWDGPMPELYAADANMWPTSKIIFATANTYVGDCVVNLKMGVVDYDEYDLSFSVSSKVAAAKSEKEFQSAFRAKHDGKTYEEWNKKRAQKTGGAGNNGN